MQPDSSQTGPAIRVVSDTFSHFHFESLDIVRYAHAAASELSAFDHVTASARLQT